MDYNIKLSGMYNCHSWTDVSGVNVQVNTFASTAMDSDTISRVIFKFNALITLDNPFVRLE